MFHFWVCILFQIPESKTVFAIEMLNQEAPKRLKSPLKACRALADSPISQEVLCNILRSPSPPPNRPLA
jgi:hypothetical protein